MSRHKDQIFRDDHEPESGEVHGKNKREQLSHGPEDDDHEGVKRPSFNSKALLFEEFEVEDTKEEPNDSKYKSRQQT